MGRSTPRHPARQPRLRGLAGTAVPGDLTWAEGQAPTPHGALQVSWAGQGGAHEFRMSVTAPLGTNGSIAVPTYGAANPVVEGGGTVVWSGGSFTATTGIGGATGYGTVKACFLIPAG